MRRGIEYKKKARVLLIDDNYEHLTGIKEIISMEGEFDVVGTSTSANVGISLAKKTRPDIILMDINMPEKDGLQAIQEIETLNCKDIIADDWEIVTTKEVNKCQNYIK